MTTFSDKSIIVTGGQSGMGAATAGMFANAGATVTIVDRQDSSVGDHPGMAHISQVLVGDVGDSRFCHRVVTEVMDRLGRIDVLVNAAGAISRHNTLTTSDDDWQRVMSTNVDGLFYMSRAVLRVMMAQRSGAIINFGSIWGHVGAPGVIAYCASKGAVHQITRAMALEFAQDGIRINAVCPGEVNTPMLQSERPEPVTKEMLEALADTVPAGRLAEPEEIARVVFFLASDEASYMTGSLVNVDAGYSA